MEEISSPQPTSETFFDGNATDNSIPDSAENVNRKEQKKTETPNSALKRGAAVTEQSSLISSESPVISIANFIQYVKNIPNF